jgi:cellulose biosynthesis protein BcsQ
MAKRRLRGDAHVLTWVRRKGGIGTTTSTIALGSGLAAKGYAVLILEGDDNRRLSRTLLGLDRPNAPIVQDSQTTYHLFTNPDEGIGNSHFELDIAALVAEIPEKVSGQRANIIARRGWQHPSPLRIVPGTRSLRRLEADYILAAKSRASADFSPYTQLTKAIDTIRRDFDFILIDTPSMLGTIAMNEVMAAQHALFLLDFDPDSRFDFDEAVDFWEGAHLNCARLGLPTPEPLGVIYNKYVRETDEPLYRAYVGGHYDEDEGDLVGQLVPFPELVTLPFDDRTMKAAQRKRRPVHFTDPDSLLGTQMHIMCEMVEVALNIAPAGATR